MLYESEDHGFGGMSYFLDRPKTEQLHPLNITLNSLEIGHSSIQGYRPQMEDQFIAQTLPDLPDHVLVAVLDGHAGQGAAQFVSRRLPTVLSLTEQFKSYLKMEPKTRGSEAAIDLLSAALVQAYVNIDSLYEQYENRVRVYNSNIYFFLWLGYTLTYTHLPSLSIICYHDTGSVW